MAKIETLQALMYLKKLIANIQLSEVIRYCTELIEIQIIFSDHLTASIIAIF